MLILKTIKLLSTKIVRTLTLAKQVNNYRVQK